MATLPELMRDIASAIRTKKGTTSPINPQDFAREIMGIEGGSGYTVDDIASGLVSGNLYFFTDAIGAYSFYNDEGITSVYAPNVTTIGTYAFYNISNITSINAPNVTTIGNYAFTAPKVAQLNFPLLTSIGTNCFTNCPSINSVNLPELGAVGASCLGYIGVTNLILPKAKSIGNSALTNSKTLAYVDLPVCTSIVNNGLRNNSKLETLILRSETMCTLSNYALNSTKIANKTGYVYVPSALIESYKVATNWSKMATQFRALEEYTIDGTINGELDESKI